MPVNTEIRNIFTIDTSSLEGILAKDRGLYIPDYQRPYSWNEEQIELLIKDICAGLKTILKKTKTATFIGTLITYGTDKGTHAENYQDNGHQELCPNEIYEVVDGQQRLTTLCLFLISLHHELMRDYKTLLEEMEKEGYEDCKKFKNIILSSMSRIQKCFLTSAGFQGRKVPKIIRHGESVEEKDKWGEKEDYYSPIGTFINQYNKYQKHYQNTFLDNGGTTLKEIEGSVQPSIVDPFKYEVNKNSTNQSQQKDFKKKAETMLKLIRELVQRKTAQSKDEMPDIQDLTNNGNIPKELFYADENNLLSYFDDEMKKVLDPDEDSILHEVSERIIRFLCFINYSLGKVALSEINVSDQDYAFEIFESLNTTGEPLNALETLKPKVVKHVQNTQSWYGSEEHKYFSIISEYINNVHGNKKNKVLRDILSWFHYSRHGSPLKSTLNEQRRFLGNDYESLNSKEEKEKFIKNLMFSSRFHQYLWELDGSIYPDVVFDDNEAKVCMHLLNSANHYMPNGIILRYYQQFAEEHKHDEKKDKCLKNLYEIIKASTAFYILYRSTKSSTEGIDQWYREILKGNSKKLKDLEENNTSLESFKGLSYNATEDLADVTKIKEIYKKILEWNNTSLNETDKTEWATSVASKALYGRTTAIAKFILMLVYNQRHIKGTGLGEKSESIIEVFNADTFQSKNFNVEHISPQNASDPNADGWDKKIYDFGNPLGDALGNLTLLPPVNNSSIGNKNWEHKKYFYKILSAEKNEEKVKIIKEAKEKKVTFSPNAVSSITGKKYIHMVKGLSEYEQFNSETITERGKEIAELAHDLLMEWLD